MNEMLVVTQAEELAKAARFGLGGRGFAVTARNGARNETAEMGDWSEDSDIDEGKSVGDPAESGFDIPVL